MLAALIGFPYRAGISLRNKLYESGLLSTHAAGRPVLCVGNLTFGGTGKTPMVAWLAAWFQDQGIRVGILSRGYGGGAEGNEEAALLAEMVPGIPHVQEPDRVAGARRLIEEEKVQAILMDDGYQHLRLQRDLNLLLLDATDPFGGGVCPPWGRLREPLAGMRRADAIVLTRVDLVKEQRRKEIWNEVDRWNAAAPRAEVSFAPTIVLDPAANEEQPVAAYKGKAVTLVSAIGNPRAFQQTVESCGLVVRTHHRFRDHHRYTAEDLGKVFHSRDVPVMTTGKDWMKIRAFPEFRPLVLKAEVDWRSGRETLEGLLNSFRGTIS